MKIDDLQMPRDRITIAILALGGQGGGVLADWITEIGNQNGFIAQGTSVPGVAQRTGTTIYYIEMVRASSMVTNQPLPVLALTPAPGDVDIVIASELMEGGRAILRGFVTEDRTTLISSTHRVFTISEKSVPGNGIAAGERILEAARRRAKRFIGFDMEEAADRAGSLISSVMLGALAGSGALPFSGKAYEEAIERGGKAVASNLKGFAYGLEQSKGVRIAVEEEDRPPQATTANGRALQQRIEASFPPSLHPYALMSVSKLCDYQDARYAGLYCDRLERVHATDDGADDWRMTRETARYLGLWMAYEDTIRVADLKVRHSRFERVRNEVRVGQGQILNVTEYMHPRLQEVCEMLPRRLGSAILRNSRLKSLIEPLFSKGRHVQTTSLRWFTMLHIVAAFRPLRRSSLRYAQEQERIEHWLDLLCHIARLDIRMGGEVATLPRIIKGYSDTFERGLQRFETILALVPDLAREQDGAQRVAALRDAALADESHEHFDTKLEHAKAT